MTHFKFLTGFPFLLALFISLIVLPHATPTLAGERWYNYGQAKFKADRMKNKGYDLESIVCKHQPMSRKRTSGLPFNRELQVQLKFSKTRTRRRGGALTSFEASLLRGNAGLSNYKNYYRRMQKQKSKPRARVPIKFVVVREGNKKKWQAYYDLRDRKDL